MRHRVLNLVTPGASLFETSTPVGVWGARRSATQALSTDFSNCSLDGGDVELEGGVTMGALTPVADVLAGATMLVVPTWPIGDRPVDEATIEVLRHANRAGTRVVGLCLGAFAVAAAGLLEGASAVTHWAYRDLFESSFPNVCFEPNTLYVDNGSVVTSAGSAAALDCCLHLTRRDHGAEAAAALARSLVTAPHRSGAQSQFAAAPEVPQRDDAVSNALAHAAERIGEISSVGDLVSLMPVGRRTLERYLTDRMGVTPKGWLDEQRVIAACRLLETTDLSVEQVADAAGYGSTPTLRRALRMHRQTTPTVYRSSFRG